MPLPCQQQFALLKSFAHRTTSVRYYKELTRDVLAHSNAKMNVYNVDKTGLRKTTDSKQAFNLDGGFSQEDISVGRTQVNPFGCEAPLSSRDGVEINWKMVSKRIKTWDGNISLTNRRASSSMNLKKQLATKASQLVGNRLIYHKYTAYPPRKLAGTRGPTAL